MKTSRGPPGSSSSKVQDRKICLAAFWVERGKPPFSPFGDPDRSALLLLTPSQSEMATLIKGAEKTGKMVAGLGFIPASMHGDFGLSRLGFVFVQLCGCVVLLVGGLKPTPTRLFDVPDTW